MFLAVLVFILVLVLNYLPKYGTIVSRWLCQVLFKVDDDELDLRSELRDLKTEQTNVSMSDEFAMFFKLQRKIDRLGEDVKQRGSTRNQKISAITMAVQLGGQIFQVLALFLTIYLLREQPLLEFPSAWFFPFQKLVAFPTGVGGVLGIGFWIFVCHAVITRVSRFLVLLQ